MGVGGSGAEGECGARGPTAQRQTTKRTFQRGKKKCRGHLENSVGAEARRELNCRDQRWAAAAEKINERSSIRARV